MRITNHGIDKLAQRLADDASPKDVQHFAHMIYQRSPIYAQMLLDQLEMLVHPDPGAHTDA